MYGSFSLLPGSHFSKKNPKWQIVATSFCSKLNIWKAADPDLFVRGGAFPFTLAFLFLFVPFPPQGSHWLSQCVARCVMVAICQSPFNYHTLSRRCHNVIAGALAWDWPFSSGRRAEARQKKRTRTCKMSTCGGDFYSVNTWIHR